MFSLQYNHCTAVERISLTTTELTEKIALQSAKDWRLHISNFARGIHGGAVKTIVLDTVSHPNLIDCSMSRAHTLQNIWTFIQLFLSNPVILLTDRQIIVDNITSCLPEVTIATIRNDTLITVRCGNRKCVQRALSQSYIRRSLLYEGSLRKESEIFIEWMSTYNQGCGLGLGLNVSVSIRSNVSSQSRLDKNCKRLGLVSVSEGWRLGLGHIRLEPKINIRPNAAGHIKNQLPQIWRASAVMKPFKIIEAH